MLSPPDTVIGAFPVDLLDCRSKEIGCVSLMEILEGVSRATPVFEVCSDP